MNERDWLVSENPRRMLEFLRAMNSADAVGESPCPAPHTSDRKFRLFAQACEQSFFPGRFTYASDLEASNSHMGYPPAEDAMYWAAEMSYPERPIRAAMLRDIVGNPFRPVSLCGSSDHGSVTVRPYRPACQRLRTPTVLAIASAINSDRDFGALPILADALEEAGCDSEELLRHLRGWERCRNKLPHESHRDCAICLGSGWQPIDPNAPYRSTDATARAMHVRGCWALDLVLGRE